MIKNEFHLRIFALFSCLFLIISPSQAEERSLHLADHFPVDTQIYAESEISSLANIDSFIKRWLRIFSEGEAVLFSLVDGINSVIPGSQQPATTANFLGNRVAFGIAEFELATSTQLLALEIINRELARHWLEESLAAELENGALLHIELPQGVNRYQPESELLGTAYEIHEDVLLIASAAKAFRDVGESTLWENERLLSSYEKLPLLYYPSILLLEGETLLLRALGEAMVNPTIAEILPPLGRNWLTLIDALGDAAVGFRPIAGTQLFEVVLAIQTQPGHSDSLPKIEFSSVPQDELRIDYTLPSPQDTALVLLGNNLGADVDQLLTTITSWSGWLASVDALPDDLFWLTTLKTILSFALRTTSELDWEKDLLEWMRGPYELTLKEGPPNFSLKSRSVNPMKTEASFQQLRETLNFYDPINDVFTPSLELPSSWEMNTLELQLFTDGQWAHLRQVPSEAPFPDQVNDSNIHRYLNHRLPNSQLFLFLEGEKLTEWAHAIDPSLANIIELGEMAISLQWQEPIIMIQWLYSMD